MRCHYREIHHAVLRKTIAFTVSAAVQFGVLASFLGYHCIEITSSSKILSTLYYQIIIIIIIKLLLIARKLTLEYDQMRVTSRIPKNYKKCFKKNYIHLIKTKIRHIKNYLHRIKNKITSN